ncbi:MAG: Zn-ribbon domain-containing OB-fold protein [Deltaproteobacteria bacterium]|nr:Zn-ribbon domain-containing OB-fold protein [Deltaproteobacteria bacterium]
MIDQDLNNVEPLVYESKIGVPYYWWAGDTATRFLEAIRDKGELWGTRCPECGKVFVPPRKSCPRCFGQQTSWEKVGPGGTVVTYTVARKKREAIPEDVPVVFALIRLDGADTAMLHKIGGVDPDKVSTGMRVKPRFAEERKGHIRDIECFIPD